VVYQDENGLHYHPGHGALPSGYVECRKIDIELERVALSNECLDLATAFEVLEHFKFGPTNFMLEANRLLKDGGKLLITTPNATSAQSISQSLRGLHPAECCLYHRNPRGGRVHPLEYDGNQLKQLVEYYGFEIEIIASVNLTPFSEMEDKAAEFAMLYRNETGKTDSSDFGEKWLLIARRIKSVAEPCFPPLVFE
jgi:SAM-dependent methyltransferase